MDKPKHKPLTLEQLKEHTKGLTLFKDRVKFFDEDEDDLGELFNEFKTLFPDEAHMDTIYDILDDHTDNEQHALWLALDVYDNLWYTVEEMLEREDDRLRNKERVEERQAAIEGWRAYRSR